MKSQKETFLSMNSNSPLYPPLPNKDRCSFNTSSLLREERCHCHGGLLRRPFAKLPPPGADEADRIPQEGSDGPGVGQHLLQGEGGAQSGETRGDPSAVGGHGEKCRGQ